MTENRCPTCWSTNPAWHKVMGTIPMNPTPCPDPFHTSIKDETMTQQNSDDFVDVCQHGNDLCPGCRREWATELTRLRGEREDIGAAIGFDYVALTAERDEAVTALREYRIIIDALRECEPFDSIGSVKVDIPTPTHPRQYLVQWLSRLSTPKDVGNG